MKYVEEEWQKFRRHVVPAEAGPGQLRDMRNAFFAGAYTLLHTMIDKLDGDADEEPTAENMELRQALKLELDVWQAECEARAAGRQ